MDLEHVPLGVEDDIVELLKMLGYIEDSGDFPTRRRHRRSGQDHGEKQITRRLVVADRPKDHETPEVRRPWHPVRALS